MAIILCFPETSEIKQSTSIANGFSPCPKRSGIGPAQPIGFLWLCLSDLGRTIHSPTRYHTTSTTLFPFASIKQTHLVEVDRPSKSVTVFSRRVLLTPARHGLLGLVPFRFLFRPLALLDSVPTASAGAGGFRLRVPSQFQRAWLPPFASFEDKHNPRKNSRCRMYGPPGREENPPLASRFPNCMLASYLFFPTFWFIYNLWCLNKIFYCGISDKPSTCDMLMKI